MHLHPAYWPLIWAVVGIFLGWIVAKFFNKENPIIIAAFLIVTSAILMVIPVLYYRHTLGSVMEAEVGPLLSAFLSVAAFGGLYGFIFWNGIDLKNR